MAEKSKVKSFIQDKIRAIVLLFVILVIFCLFNVITKGGFFDAMNFNALLSHPVVPAFMAWGISFVFTTGATDMSIGAVLLFSSNIAAILGLDFGLGYFGIFLGSIVTSVLCTVLTMFICTRLKIPAWICGLGMCMFYEAALGILSSIRANLGYGIQLPNLGSQYRELGQTPWVAIVWVLGCVLAYILYNKTAIGIKVRALNSNVAITKTMGANTNHALLQAALVGGIFFGIAAAVNISYSGTVRAVSGLSSTSQIFKPIAIFILAKVYEKSISLPVGILIFSCFIMGLFNFLTRIGVPTGTGQDIVLGICVILFSILSAKGPEERRAIVK